MGYELSIQREGEQNIISLEEWRNYLHSDPEFTVEFPTVLNNGKTVDVESIYWKSVSGIVPFSFSEKWGSIVVKNPDDIVIEKMISIAKKFNAVVIGDDGEQYDEDYLKQLKQKSTRVIKSWWQFWKN